MELHRLEAQNGAMTSTETATVLASFNLQGAEIGSTVALICRTGAPTSEAFEVHKDGEIVSKSHLTYDPALFSDASEAMNFALELTGWSEAL